MRGRMNRENYLLAASQYCLRGQDLPQAKLLDMDVIAIRSAKRQRDNLVQYIRENLSNEALAKQYGVHVRTIEKAVTRETFCHLP